MTEFVGRYLSVPDNYKNPELGKQIYDKLVDYHNSRIEVPEIGVKHPNVAQIFIGPKVSFSGKDVSKFMNRKYIDKIHNFIRKNNFKLYIHGNYLSQLTRPIDTNKTGLHSVINELKSAYLLGAAGVIVHLGHYSKTTESPKNSIENIIKSVVYIIEEFRRRVKNKNHLPYLLLETPSGQGREVGAKFSELGYILKKVQEKVGKQVKTCLDTCHIFSAGYDLRTIKETVKTLREFNKYVGLNNLVSIHFNDSAYPFNSHTDHHYNIGCGYIGSEELGGSLNGFRAITKFAKKHGISIILETPSREVRRSQITLSEVNEDELKAVYSMEGPKKESQEKNNDPLAFLESMKILDKNNILYSLIDYC